MFLQLLKSAHFYKTWAHIFVAAMLTLFIGAGVHATGGLVLGVVSAAVLSGVMLFGGFGSTIFSRGIFGLMQVGIFLQVAMFWVAGMIAAYVTALVLPVAITSYMCVSATMILGYIFVAAGTGHLKQYYNRSFLPVKMPKD
jgi:hypothetical protein